MPEAIHAAADQAQEPAYPPGVAFIDGEFKPISQAKISVLDWGLLRSDATYDVAHVWQGRFFRLDDHLDRFLQSVAKLRLQVPVDREELAAILAECVTRAGLQDAYVEMVCTRGTSPTFSRDPRDAVNRFFAFAIPFGWILTPEQRLQGLDVAIAEHVQRIPPGAVDPTAKNYHWLDLVMGLFEAYDRGAANVILTDGAGLVTEGPGFNVFVVSGGRVATPDLGVLEGITRRTALELCAELQIPTDVRPVSVAELGEAEEVFITSTAGGVMPVTRLDGRPVASGEPGPLTLRLIETYWAKHTDPAWSIAVESLLPNHRDRS